MFGFDLSGICKSHAPHLEYKHSLGEIRSTQIHFVDSTESSCFTTVFTMGCCFQAQQGSLGKLFWKDFIFASNSF
jgi:hypothetical protein